jgi:hypothetical protein
LPDATISDLKDILSVFEKEKITEFDHFNDITADDWNTDFGNIPRRYRSRIMAYLDEGHDFSNEMLFDYYIDPVEGHRTFSRGLLELIDGYEPLSVVSSMVFPSKEDDYFYNHLIEHMVDAGGDLLTEAETLVLRLPWLLSNLNHRPNNVLDVRKDLQYILTKSISPNSNVKLFYQAIMMSISAISSIKGSQEDDFLLHMIGRPQRLSKRRVDNDSIEI